MFFLHFCCCCCSLASFSIHIHLFGILSMIFSWLRNQRPFAEWNVLGKKICWIRRKEKLSYEKFLDNSFFLESKQRKKWILHLKFPFCFFACLSFNNKKIIRIHRDRIFISDEQTLNVITIDANLMGCLLLFFPICITSTLCLQSHLSVKDLYYIDLVFFDDEKGSDQIV